MSDARPQIILFDGVCNLCDGFVQFVLDRDPRGRFVFASLQSDAARALLARHGIPAPTEPESIVLVDGDRAWQRSAAVLRVLRGLGGVWAAFAIVSWIVPRFLRDGIYRFIARHRYAWFGKRAECRVPTPDLRARFLEARPDLR